MENEKILFLSSKCLTFVLIINLLHCIGFNFIVSAYAKITKTSQLELLVHDALQFLAHLF